MLAACGSRCAVLSAERVRVWQDARWAQSAVICRGGSGVKEVRTSGGRRGPSGLFCTGEGGPLASLGESWLFFFLRISGFPFAGRYFGSACPCGAVRTTHTEASPSLPTGPEPASSGPAPEPLPGRRQSPAIHESNGGATRETVRGRGRLGRQCTRRCARPSDRERPRDGRCATLSRRMTLGRGSVGCGAPARCGPLSRSYG